MTREAPTPQVGSPGVEPLTSWDHDHVPEAMRTGAECGSPGTHSTSSRGVDCRTVGLTREVVMADLAPTPSTLEDLRVLAAAFTELGDRLSTVDAAAPFEAIADLALERISDAVGASITIYQRAHFATVAATDDRIRRADALQYELGSGPCVDAIVDETAYRPRDLRTDDRWPVYGKRVAEELGLCSMLSYRMLLQTREVVAGLNLYAEQPDSFTDREALIGLLLATHGAQAASAALNRRRAEELEQALRTNRRIGMAMGILMARHQVTDDQAFDLLRIASQNSNRKLADIARDVCDTGALDVPLTRRGP